MVLACGHDAEPYRLPVCRHLRATGGDHYVRYTGAGLQTMYVCGNCKGMADTAQEDFCDACASRLLAGLQGVCGAPEVLQQLVPVDTTVKEWALPADAGRAVDMAVTARGVLLLAADGRILRWTPGERSGAEVGRTTIAPALHAQTPRQGDESYRLHASEDGLFAAVVIDHGRHGEVIDLSTGRVTLALDNDGYCSTTVPFSCTFTLHEQRCVVVYRAQWNQLRACDAATGKPMTEIPTDDAGAPWISVFHGAVLASPGGSRIVSDAWHWPGFGSVLVWNLETWLDEGDSAWPTAIGFSEISGGRNLWNRPLAWLDEDSLVVGGIGGSRQTMVDGATLYRFSDGDAQQPEVTAFAGPRGRFFAANGLLCSSGDAGMDVWDPRRGARIAVIPGFRPTHRGRSDGELLHLDSTTHIVRSWVTR